MPIYRRPDSDYWWCFYWTPDRRRIRKNTLCTDRRAAERTAARFEREAVDPPAPAAPTVSLERALERLVDDRRARGKADGTIDMYAVKGRQLVRVMGNVGLDTIDANAVDAYIARRLKGEELWPAVERTTVHKELTTLRAALKLAIRRGEYPHALERVMPIGFSPEYEPREGYVRTPKDLQLLLDALPSHRRGLVAFIVATGARISEALRARRADIDLERGTVRMRGTKTKGSKAVIPVASFLRPLLEYALVHGADNGPLYQAWGNMGRDLPAACAAAGLERLTANDLRRTTATWLRQGGVAPHLIAGVLRHRDSRMVERVYGRMPVDGLGPAVEAGLGQGVETVTVH
jgi:integrase